MFTETILPAIISALLPVLLALVAWASKAAVTALNKVSADKDASALEKMAAQVGARLTTVVDGVIDEAALETSGVLAQMQRPESPGGIDVTPEEWRQIKSTLLARAKAGFGAPWLSRLAGLITGNPNNGDSPTVANAIGAAIESRVAARTDIAIASGLRKALPGLRADAIVGTDAQPHRGQHHPLTRATPEP